MSDCNASEARESEGVRLLASDGQITVLRDETLSSWQRIDGEIDPAKLASFSLAVSTLVVDFNGAADGRGYSLAKALRDAGFKGRLYAGGYINPDQLSMVLQTGFDGVLAAPDRWVDYGEVSWKSALTPIVRLSYAFTNSVHHRSIWHSRHSR